MAVVIFVCTGCNAEETNLSELEQETKRSTAFAGETAGVDTSLTQETGAQEDAEQEPEASFKVAYQGQEAKNAIELRHCEQVYHADGIWVYAKYLYWLMVPESFPCNQYVLYIQTPQEQVQLYPVKDFLVDKDQGILYTKIAGEEGFERVQCIFLMEEDGLSPDNQREIFDVRQAEEMLDNAYGRNGELSDFSDVTVELLEAETGGTGILHGETGGIEKATGQRYYVNWKIDIVGNIQSVTPCILKQYDSDKDREIFADSSRMFDQIEQGDWSCVKPIEGMDYLWGATDGKWLRMDVNGDGLPELVNGFVIDEIANDEIYEKISITFIFAYQNQTVELVYTDVNDGMEFLFIAGNGNLVYQWCVSGGPCMNLERLCCFDLKWNKEYLDTLVLYRFPEGDGMDPEYYRENYSDTFGVGGYGTYYLRERKKTKEELADNADGKYIVREYLTEEQFLDAYEKMTGWDFYKSQIMY